MLIRLRIAVTALVIIAVLHTNANAQNTYTLRYTGPEFMTGFGDTPNLSISGYADITTENPIQAGDVFSLRSSGVDYSFSLASSEEYKFGFSSDIENDSQFGSIRFENIEGRLQVSNWNISLSNGQPTNRLNFIGMKGGSPSQLAEDQYFEPRLSQNRQVRYAHPNYVLSTSLPRLQTWDFAERVETQTVLLDFDGADFKIEQTQNPFLIAYGDDPVYVRNDNATTEASEIQFDRQIVASSVENIYRLSGIDGIRFVTDQSDAGDHFTTLHFGDRNASFLQQQTTILAGQAVSGVDRFNSDKNGTAIIHVDETVRLANRNAFNNAEQAIAGAAAHELGHLLGLAHIANDTGVMSSLPFSENLRFTSTPTPLSDRGLSQFDHNPLYHLERYVDGESHDDLIARGILPGGEYDTGLLDISPSSNLLFDLENDIRLFDVQIIKLDELDLGEGLFASPFKNFDDILLSELNGLTINNLDEFVFTASSTAGGLTDVVLTPNLSPFSSPAFSVGTAEATFNLYKVDDFGQQQFQRIGFGNFVATSVPEPNCVLAFIGMCLGYSAKRRRKSLS